MSVGPVDLYTPSEASQPTSAPRWNSSRYLIYAALLFISAFFAAIRFRLRDIPLERDEGEFAYGGQLILEGAPLYANLYTLKMPGTYAAYAGIMAAFGQTCAGIHTGLILINTGTTLLVFLLTAKLFGRLAGLVAAASYAAVSTSPAVLGYAAHATHFVVLFAMAGLYLLLMAVGNGKGWQFSCSGLLLGIAFLMKQPAVFFLVFAALYLARQKPRSSGWTKLASQLATVAFGAVLPFLVTCFLTWRSGTFQKFWFWTFSYASRYGTNASLADGFASLKDKSGSVVAAAIAIWIVAGLGLTTILWNRCARAHRFFLVAFLLLSVLAVSPGLFFREHYFILMLPAVSMLAGVAVSSSTEMLHNRAHFRGFAFIPLLLFVAAFSSALYEQKDFLFSLNPAQAAKKEYGQNPFREALEIAKYIASDSQADSTVAVLGCEPEIYFYAHRRAATGHTCLYPVLEPKYGVVLQKQMEQEIESSRPEVLVLIDEPTSWLAFPNALPMDDLLNWAKGYVRKYYTVIGVAEMDKYSTEYIWGERAARHPLAMARNIVVLKRRPS